MDLREILRYLAMLRDNARCLAIKHEIAKILVRVRLFDILTTKFENSGDILQNEFDSTFERNETTIYTAMAVDRR